MSSKRMMLAGLIFMCMLAGCLMAPVPQGGGVAFVPILPPIVVLGPEPYYVQGGYHYYYRDGGWAYSHSRSGPWMDLPRDHYPREVRFKDGGNGRGGGRNPGHQGK